MFFMLLSIIQKNNAIEKRTSDEILNEQITTPITSKLKSRRFQNMQLPIVCHCLKITLQ